jgi:hypothetical protein
MARTVVLVVAILLLAFGAIVSIAAPDSQPDLAGVYECVGTNPDGTQYQGVVQIEKTRDTFSVKWGLSDGVVTGVGIVSDGLLAVSYFGGAPAVVLYKIEGNRLIGHWTMGAEGTVYAETLTKSDSAAPPQRRRRPSNQPPSVSYQARR